MDEKIQAEARRLYQKAHNEVLLGDRVVNCMRLENDLDTRKYYIEDRAWAAIYQARRKVWRR